MISALYQRIALDPRHKDVAVVAAGEQAERDCAGGAMGYVDKRDVVEAAVRRFSASSTYDPYSMGSDSIVGLIQHIANTSGAVRTTTPR